MALGKLSALGVGSGVFSMDTIDQMKNLDIKAQVDPMTKRLDKLKEQEDAMTNLITLTATLKTVAVDLSDDTAFQKRSVSVNRKDVAVTANDGVAVQDMQIKVNQLAKIDINQSKGFSSEDSSVTSSDTTIITSRNK